MLKMYQEKNANDEIECEALVDLGPGEFEIEQVPSFSESDAEKTLVEIIKNTLGIDEIEVEDNLFDLGASSLTLTKVHVKIMREFNVNMSVVDLFKYPNIRLLSKFLNPNSLQGQNSSKLDTRAEKRRNALKFSRDRHGSAVGKIRDRS